MENKIDQINRLLSRVLNIEVRQITPQLRIHDVQEWDSLGHVFLVHEIENTFNVKIPFDEIYELVSVERIYSFLEGKQSVSAPKATTNQKENRVHRGLKQVYFDYTRIANLQPEVPALFMRKLSLKEFVNNLSFIEAIYYLINGERIKSAETRKYTKEFFNLSEVVCSFFSKVYVARSEYHIGIIDFLLYLRERELEYGSKFKDIEVIGGIFLCILGFVGPLPNYKTDIAGTLQEALNLSEEAVVILLKCLKISMEHGSNASSFTIRIASGTGASFTEACCAAVITFSGNKHGGALKDIYNLTTSLQGKSKESIDWLIEHFIQHKINIPGFGHSIYKKGDPRAVLLNEILTEMKPQYHETVEVGRSILESLKKYEAYGLTPNVDFYTNLIYTQIGIPPVLYLPLFIFARHVGWSAHYKEHNNNPILIRPRLKYISDE